MRDDTDDDVQVKDQVLNHPWITSTR